MAARKTLQPNSARIRELAGRQYLTPAQLRKKGKLSQVAVQNALDGRPILVDTAYRIAQVLQVAPSEICCM